ncbi:MAG TPA: type VI secretion system contractile sheath large subunit [Longimicrobiaceae bacterium]|nr:type VI secretion system contractile sheath large subunit [Longimicrobiaceae bacterium]
MADPFATVHLDASSRPGADAAPIELEERPFTVVVLGDFSARASRRADRAELSGLRPLSVDRDDIDEVLERLAPRLRLDGQGASFETDFREIDDFHPDGLYDRAGLFRELRRVRARAADAATFPAVTAELGQGGEAPAPAPRAPSGTAGMLDLILDEAEPPAAPMEVIDSRAELERYVRRLVAGHLVAGPDPRQAEVVARIDAAIGEEMRVVLHHPSFQALEALWRALFLLVRRVETGPLLRIRVLDVTRAELEADLGRDDPARGAVGSALASVTPAVVVVAEAFGPEPADLDVLRRLAELGRAVGAPVLAAAAPSLVGCPAPGADPAEWSPTASGWEALRREPAARFLGLAFPRFLLRLPYGEDAEECERFRFEESPGHEEYLWGSPAIACAIMIAQAFSAAGWEMRPGMVRGLEGLPLHLVRSEGETSAKPCAEAWMSERAAGRILDAGVMPLASLKDRDAVQLVRFQSIASPPAALAGRWGG